MNTTGTIILIPIFIIILLVIYKAINSGLSLGPARTMVLSVCVSLLSVLGMSHCLNGSLEVILLPYAAMGISILVLLVALYFWEYLKRLKERAKMRDEK